MVGATAHIGLTFSFRHASNSPAASVSFPAASVSFPADYFITSLL